MKAVVEEERSWVWTDSVRQMEMWEQWVVPASVGSGTGRAFRDCPILQVRKMRVLRTLKGAAGIQRWPLPPQSWSSHSHGTRLLATLPSGGGC